MKMIKFEELKCFKDLRKNMGIVTSEEDIKLKHPNVMAYMDKYNKIKFGVPIVEDENMKELKSKINISTNGIVLDKETNLNMILYMIRQRVRFDENYDPHNSNYKFHITFCDAVEEHLHKSSRWSALRKYNDTFEIKESSYGDPKLKTVYKKMKVCKYCLSKLNYKNYNNLSSAEKEKIVENFDLVEFFNQYDSNFMYIPDELKREYQEFSDECDDSYVDNWKEISREFREIKKYICDNCGRDMSHDKYNLHVHHRDHNKKNNNYSNLMCLCEECHSKMPGHEHMKKK